MSRRDRGGRGNRSGGGGLPRGVQVSKKLSWLLRHGADKEGLKLGSGGYANLADVLKTRAIRGLNPSLAEIQSLVATNDKQRFSLIPDPALSSSDPSAVFDPASPAHYLIRANQGHTLAVGTEGLLTELEKSSDVGGFVVHGTNRRAWRLIEASGGLKRMERTHVHFATGLPRGWAVPAELLGAGEAQPAEAETHDGGEEAPPPAGGSSTPPEDEGTAAPAVVSGMRSSSSVLVYLDAGKAMERGLKFWRSENGVVLCDGGEAGLVPLECFRLVEERGAGGSVVLVRDGVVVGKLKGRGS